MSAVAPAPTLSANEIGPRCLVTGGAGYVGSALVRRLQQAGCSVRSLDLAPHQHGPGVDCIRGDLTDPATLASACEGVNTVFHTAALIKLLSLARPSVRKLVWRVNVEGTAQVLEAARAAGVSAFVHTSTGNVVLDRELPDADETTPYASRAHDLYARSKIAAEQLALTADQSGGMRVCALRPGGVWGSDVDSVMLRSFLTQLAEGRFKALIGDGASTMDNTHIENLIDAQLLAARGLHKTPERIGGEAFFIMDDEPVNPVEWFRPLAEGLGHEFPRLRLPGALMRQIAWLLEAAHFVGGPEPTLCVRAVRNLTETSRLKIDKARQELGYVPRYQRANGIPEVLPAARAWLQQYARPA